MAWSIDCSLNYFVISIIIYHLFIAALGPKSDRPEEYAVTRRTKNHLSSTYGFCFSLDEIYHLRWFPTLFENHWHRCQKTNLSEICSHCWTLFWKIMIFEICDLLLLLSIIIYYYYYYLLLLLLLIVFNSIINIYLLLLLFLFIVLHYLSL